MSRDLTTSNLDPLRPLPDGKLRNHLFRRIGNMHSVMTTGLIAKAELGREPVEKLLIAAKQSQQKAEIANKAKSDFLSNVSHEIRTPMGTIIGLTNVLLATKLEDKQKHYLKLL